MAVIVNVDKRGQMVVPLEMRKELGIENGGALAAVVHRGTMVAERIKTPTTEELLRKWNETTKELNKHVQKIGIREEDVEKIIHRRRGVKD